MPLFNYACKCSNRFSATQERGTHQTSVCPACGQGATQVVGGGVSFFLRGDNWSGKNILVADQMRRKNGKLAIKQAEKAREAPEYTLVPNVQGEEVDTWREAARYAASKGLDTEAYETMAENEAGR